MPSLHVYNRALSVALQQMVELEKIMRNKEGEEATLKDALDKASEYMTHVRNGQWDGSRVATRGTVDQITHKVRMYVEAVCSLDNLDVSDT